MMIPEGDMLSTWGAISNGGLSGLDRFRLRGFEKVGERIVKQRTP